MVEGREVQVSWAASAPFRIGGHGACRAFARPTESSPSRKVQGEMLLIVSSPIRCHGSARGVRGFLRRLPSE